jgi:hypothetical protein
MHLLQRVRRDGIIQQSSFRPLNVMNPASRPGGEGGV